MTTLPSHLYLAYLVSPPVYSYLFYPVPPPPSLYITFLVPTTLYLTHLVLYNYVLTVICTV